MDKMDLKNYRALACEAEQIREALAALESSLYSPRGQRFTSTQRTPTGDRATMDGAVQKHMDLVEKYRKNLAEKEAQQLRIEAAIQSLGNTPERIVIRERYILGKPWKAVAVKMEKLGTSERDMYRLHGLALLKLKGQ